MKKLFFILMPMVLLITLGCWTLFEFESKQTAPNPPMELLAFNSLTKDEQSLVIVSPKDSNIEKVAVTEQINPLIVQNYSKNKVFKITFNHTANELQGNLVVFADTDKKTIVGKGFDGETLAALK